MSHLGLLVAVLMLVAGCGDDDGSSSSGGTCQPGQFSVANSGGLCQVNVFDDNGDELHAVYCTTTATGYDCACGPAADNPPTFQSEDFCDLEGKARVCAAFTACGF